MIAVLHRIVLTEAAQATLAEIRDRRILARIRDRIDGLSIDPEKQGKPLGDDLRGYRSLRAVGQRYRILYRVDRQTVTVSVAAVGLRKEGDRHDIYASARRLLRLGLL